MPYVIPTPAEVRAAYPQFGGVADAVIQNALDLGALAIDTTWPESAYSLAFKLYAAHVLTLDGQGSDTSGQAEEGLAANVKRRKAGDHEIEFFGASDGGAANSAAWYALTPFGTQFATLQRRYFAGPRVY